MSRSEKPSGHTPGPWHRLPGFAESGHPIYKPGKYIIRIVQKRAPDQTAFVRVALVDSDAVAADAAVIAAAPDMLAALKDLNESILGRAESNASGNPEWECVSSRINAARAAIAKAEGRS
jgi:hypothetical protein